MTSLSNQLSALTSTKKGFAYSIESSKSTAIGLGFTHSSKHGHSITAENVKRKPSVLYDNARQAADVPEVVLRENAVEALSSLQASGAVFDIDIQKLFDVHSLTFERGTSTSSQNAVIDASIDKLLKILTTYMVEYRSTDEVSTNPLLLASLQIIEYLLRKYDIHTRETSMLLSAFLPLHPSYPSILQRVLGLLDLQSLNGGMWVFLRPYAAAESPPLNRTVLAKQCAHDKAVIGAIAKMAKDAFDIWILEELEETRRGISTVLSFSASILVEGLHIQSKMVGKSGVAGVQESSVRKIFPLIIGSCGSKEKCGEWKEWGRLIASTLAMLCPLSEIVKVALCDAVAAGIPVGTNKVLFDDVTKDDWVNSTFSDENKLDDASSAIMTLLPILGSSGVKSKDEELKYYLPMYPMKQSTVDYLGCELPFSTYKTLSNRKGLFPNVIAGAMGTVFDSLCDGGSSDGNKIGSVGPLLGAIIMHVFKKMEKEATKGLRKRGRELGSDGDLFFLLSIINEKTLRSLWKLKKGSLITSLAVQNVLSFDSLSNFFHSSKCDKQRQSMIAHRYGMILDSLTTLDSAACDRGVAYGIDNVTRTFADTFAMNNEERISSLVLILGNTKSFDAAKKKLRTKYVESNAIDSAAFLLPPRVAIEHADASVRINAIAGLKVMNVASLESTLSFALLRRLSTDDDSTVVISAGDVLTKMLEHSLDRNEKSGLHDDVNSLAEEALRALFRWTTIGKDDAWSPSLLISKPAVPKLTLSKGSASTLPPLLACLRICGLVGKIISRTIDIDGSNRSIAHLFYLLFTTLIAHVHVIENEGIFKEVSQAAVGTISQLCDSDSKSPTLKQLFSDNDTCLRAIKYYYGPDYESTKSEKLEMPDPIRKRFLWVALRTLSSFIPSSLSITVCNQMIILLLHQMRSYTDASKNSTSFRSEVQELNVILTKCLLFIRSQSQEELSNVILELASANSNISFQTITKPVIGSFIARLGDDDYTGLLALVRASMHQEAQNQIMTTKRLLTIATEMFGKRRSAEGAVELLLSLLSMLSYPDQTVRQKVMKVLGKLKSIEDDMVLSICTNATDKQSPMWSSMVMDGVNALPQLLGYIITSSKSPVQLQEFLITGCLRCAIQDDSGLSNFGCHIAAVLLNSMENAGESSFPLLKRWSLAGKDLFEAFAKRGCEDKLGPMEEALRDSIVLMLKGVIINGAQPSIDQQIIVGPSKTGRRVRSYSISSSENFRVISPYPKDMTNAILFALEPSSSTPLAKSLIDLVLTRQSWANGVFPKLDAKAKQGILFALLTLRTNKDSESAGQVLLNLPLKANDMIHLLKNLDVSASEKNQLAMVFIADVIRGKLDALNKASEASTVSSLLFEHLLCLSSTKDTSDPGGKEYTRVSILQSLLALHSSFKIELFELSYKRNTSSKKRSRSNSDARNPTEVASQAKLLVGLVGGDLISVIPLHSARGKTISLSLLTCLCEESPSTVVTSLLPALSSLEGHAVGDALSVIVPAFCSHAKSAGLSLFDLFNTLVANIATNIPRNKILIDQFANALMSLPGKEAAESVAAFITCMIALEAFNVQTSSTEEDNVDNVTSPANAKSNILQVIANVNSVMKVSIALSLLQYAENMMSFICDSSQMKDDKSSRIIELALLGNGKGNIKVYANCSGSQKRSLLYLTITLLQSVQGILSTPSAKKIVRKSSGSEADLCLRLWQELMQTHVHSLGLHAPQNRDSTNLVEKKFWIAISSITNNCLESLQILLPAPHFLASVTSILTEDSDESFMKKKTIRLLTDRVAEVNHDSPEHSLFLEMVPDLVAQLKISSNSMSDDDMSIADRKAIIKQQGALIAIESFVSSLYPKSENGRLTNAASKVFLPALASVSALLTQTTFSWLKTRGDAECQLLSSCALCISSLVLNLKARCLHLLGQIIKSLIEALKSINVGFRSTAKDQSSIALQLSILRTLSTVSKVLPGFLLPHLPMIFATDALPASSVVDSDSSVVAASKDLEVSLATNTPIRQLMPCLSNALLKTLTQKDGDTGWQESCTVLRIMNVAIDNSTRSDLTSVVGKIFNGLIAAYTVGGHVETTTTLLSNTNNCLIALVMKLSETQLRSLYARLREWRGDIDSNESHSSRRYAFWSLSAELSKALKSIFFPCLTSVLSDVVDELENAVAVLCSKKKGGEAKRRRTDEMGENHENAEGIKSLQPLLLCLESALKADAHEGGDWTRGDDNQRYNVILNHLGKLLLAQIPSNMTILSSLTAEEQKTTSEYAMLIQGMGTQEHGNVVGCLTALATAAGNEQLWKPLNFAVLEACSQRRSEVRKAGVSCLLSTIESIGEEYMVLLPECLPVLSELLEDADEDIASMARDCVRQGEELLGESLEENLR